MQKKHRRRISVAVGIVLLVAVLEYTIYISVNDTIDSLEKSELTQRYKPSLDANLARPDEHYISLESFLDCLDARLNVDHRTKTEHVFTNVGVTMPYLVLPVTVEQGDMKALMCNLSVQIQHVMYVQNGGVGSMTAFLDRVQEAFAFTSRLKLPRLPQNYGYSVALNVAMRDALSMPFDEVPFLMMANNDVQIPGGMLEAGLPQMHAHSLAGRARIAELEAEVATEPNEHTPALLRDVPLRSPDGRHALVTSRLLPDRVRYQAKEERRRAFADYYGELYVDHTQQTAFWGVTRLAMEVTGYFDENCYPAYFEDTDYIRRLRLLGFKQLYIRGFEQTAMRHIGGGSILSVKGFEPAPELRDVPPFVRGATFVINNFFSAKYIEAKYGLKGRGWSNEDMREPYPQSHLPLDVYVLNEERNRAITEVQRTAVLYFSNLSLPDECQAKFPVSCIDEKLRALAPKLLVGDFGKLESYRNSTALLLLHSSEVEYNTTKIISG